MPDVVAWVFRSPGRLAGVLLAALAVVVLAAALLRGGGTGGTADGAGSAGAAGSRRVTTGSTASAVLPASGPFVDTAVRFVGAWSTLPAGGSPARWRAALAPLVTPDLARGLALTDPAELPGSPPAGAPRVRFQAVASALVEVPLASGDAVFVTVVAQDAVDGTGPLLVADVQPAAGDVGAVQSPSAVPPPSPPASPSPPPSAVPSEPSASAVPSASPSASGASS